MASWDVPFSLWYPFWWIYVPLTLLGGLIKFVTVSARRAKTVLEETQNERKQEVRVALGLAEANPESTKFAWDIARLKLEAYFDRNLSQVGQVFWLACVVMSFGFVFIFAGILLALLHPDQIKPPLVAVCSGIITQFIGATFMVIYRSTMTQANAFMTILERINTVGMAVQVVDVLSDKGDLKDKTRAEIAVLLLSESQSNKLAIKPRTVKSKVSE